MCSPLIDTPRTGSSAKYCSHAFAASMKVGSRMAGMPSLGRRVTILRLASGSSVEGVGAGVGAGVVV